MTVSNNIAKLIHDNIIIIIMQYDIVYGRILDSRHVYIDRWKIATNRVERFEDIVSIIANLQNCLLQH